MLGEHVQHVGVVVGTLAGRLASAEAIIRSRHRTSQVTGVARRWRTHCTLGPSQLLHAAAACAMLR